MKKATWISLGLGKRCSGFGLKCQQPSTLLGSRNLVLSVQFFYSSLGHEVCDIFLQVIDSAAHVIDPSDDLIRHNLKLVLHLLQERLHHQGDVLHGLGVRLGHLSGAQLGGDVSEPSPRLRFLGADAHKPTVLAARQSPGREALWVL